MDHGMLESGAAANASAGYHIFYVYPDQNSIKSELNRISGGGNNLIEIMHFGFGQNKK